MDNRQSKVALVTGGSRGIGKGIALVLAEHGFDVAITHWDDAKQAGETAQFIAQSTGKRCVVLEGDLQTEDAPVKLAVDAIQAFGRIDVLVNNAGATLFQSVFKMDEQTINHLLHLDLRAPLLLMREIGKHMAEQGIYGNIVNITSTRSERAYPTDAVYGGVKAALTRATASIALDLSQFGIRVNCIAPGAIQRENERPEYFQTFGAKIPLRRSGTIADVGRAVAWLVSEQASYITGTTIRVDGGLILPGMPEDIDSPGWGTQKNSM